MDGLPGLPKPGFSGLPGLPAPGFSQSSPAPVEDQKKAPLTAGETVVGGIGDIYDKLTFGAGDEIVAGGNAVIDALGNATGLYEGAPLGEAYDQRLQQYRDLTKQFKEEHPTVSAVNNLAAFLAPVPTKVFSTAKGVVPFARNVAAGAGLGAAYGGASGFLSGEGGYDKRIEDAKSSAELGALLGGGTSAVLGGLGVAANRLKKSADTIEGELVGYKPDLKQKPTSFVDEAGNLTKNVGEASSQVSRKDLDLENLRDSGFFEKVKITDTPETVATKLAVFNKQSGKALGETVDLAAKLESDVLASLPENAKQAFLSNGDLNFNNAREFISEFKDISPRLYRTLSRDIRDLERAWNNSDKSVTVLKNIQEQFGKLNQGVFRPGATVLETKQKQLVKILYGELAGSLQNRISAIAEQAQTPRLAQEFQKANRAFSSSKTFVDSAFNASRKSVWSRIGQDLFSFTPGGLGRTILTKVSQGVPVLGPVTAAERLATLASDIAPVQVSKLSRKTGQVLEALTPFQKVPKKVASSATPKSFSAKPETNSDLIQMTKKGEPVFNDPTKDQYGRPIKSVLENAGIYPEGHPLNNPKLNSLRQEETYLSDGPYRKTKDGLEKITPAQALEDLRKRQNIELEGLGNSDSYRKKLLEERHQKEYESVAQYFKDRPKKLAEIRDKIKEIESKLPIGDAPFNSDDKGSAALGLAGAGAVGSALAIFSNKSKKTMDKLPEDEKLKPLVDAVISQESGGKANATSEKGAQGLMQLLPSTGKELFNKYNIKGEYDPYDPEQNRALGTLYLKELLKKYKGDKELALTAYHSGPGRVDQLLKKTGGSSLNDIIDELGPIGQKYARQVLNRINLKEA